MEYSNVTAKIFRLILVKLIAKDPKELTKSSKFLLFLKDFFLFIAVAIQFNINDTYIFIYILQST